MMTPDESDEVLNEIADVLDLGEPELDRIAALIEKARKDGSK